MIDYLKNIQERLLAIETLKYVDEDWGQLDDYGMFPPTKWPCALIDITGADYSNIGLDKSAIPMQRQQGTGNITITFANLKLTNTSGKAPLLQKEKAWMLIELIELTHSKLQGFRPADNCGALTRSAFRRIKRDDGIQQYQVTYSIGINNV